MPRVLPDSTTMLKELSELPPSRLLRYEAGFIKSSEMVKRTGHLTTDQLEKLRQIYTERVLEGR